MKKTENKLIRCIRKSILLVLLLSGTGSLWAQRLKTMEILLPGGEESRLIDFSYDSRGRLLSMADREPGSNYCDISFEYAKISEPETIHYELKGEWSYNETMTLNYIRKNRIYKVSVSGVDVETREIYSYDDEGRISLISWYGDGYEGSQGYRYNSGVLKEVLLSYQYEGEDEGYNNYRLIYGPGERLSEISETRSDPYSEDEDIALHTFSYTAEGLMEGFSVSEYDEVQRSLTVNRSDTGTIESMEFTGDTAGKYSKAVFSYEQGTPHNPVNQYFSYFDVVIGSLPEDVQTLYSILYMITNY
ncbi:MAG: hypothetical protein PQJ50_18535 [Spirochaetales bacterium]|nr:hypothetical protein [Spirochaetales bacterium]